MSGLARPELDPAWYVDRDEDVSLEEFCNIEDLDALNRDNPTGEDGDEDVNDDIGGGDREESDDEIGLGDKTIDYDETIGLKLGVVFPDKKSAEKSIRRWCDSNFCPLAKVSKVQ